MRTHAAVAATLAGLAVALLGCGEANRPTEPSAEKSALAATSLPVRRVSMMDACDPTSFNAAIAPGTCVSRRGGVTFTQFIAQLTRNEQAGAWHNAPPNMTARPGQTLLAVNRGGEVHTFTQVAAFGGGVVGLLNQLSGNPNIAPECTRLDADDFVPPGGTYEEEVGSAATQLFQCCIHPWMRTVVHTR
jgi:hypothetical protein